MARKGQAGAGWAIRLAADRAIAPNSVTGVSVLLACCAAAWFSGGTGQDDALGLIATGAWVLARVSARQLAAVIAQRAGPLAAEPAARGVGHERAGGFDWLYAVCATAAECVIYCGIAVGAQADGWTGTWPLALACVIVGSVAALAQAVSQAVSGQEGQPTRPILSRLVPFAPPAWLGGRTVGLRVLIAALIMVGYGPRVALFAVLATGTVSGVRGVIATAARISAAQSVPRAPLAGQGLLLVYRDDGPLARRAGWLVRGNLMPLPSVIAGVIAIALLAVLGLKNLPGIVALTPVVVLLLAAPGSSHPHDGRFDWLAPLLLCIGQYGCLTVLGAAKSVSWPIIYTACAMTAVWYASLIASPAVMTSAPASAPVSRKAWISRIMAMRPDGIGWDGRVTLLGLTGMFGMAVFGYLGLAAYLGALLLRKVAIGYLMPGEDQRR
jgi:hypothetical protein